MLLLLSLLFCCLVELHCEEISIPFLSFKSQNLLNNSYVDITEIADSSSDSIECRSELPNCCQTAGNLTGSWSFPNGSELLSGSSGDSIIQSRGTRTAQLRRRHNNMANTAVGIYCCRIAYNSSNPLAKETLCVGIYGSSAGRVEISDDVSFTVNSDLNGDSPQFTLTCISTGGPATTVTWTRDSTITVTEGTLQTVLNNTMTSLYIHTLTVTGRNHGLYNCTVENSVYSDSATYTVQVAFPPTNVTYKVQDDFTSILLMWVPPSSLGDTTGYRISYNAVGGSSNSVNISDGTTSNHTLSDLEKGKDYNILIVGTSDHFFSMSVEWGLITLKERQDSNGGSDGNGDESVGQIAAGIIIPLILLAVIAAIAILVFFFLRRRRGSKSLDPTYSTTYRPANVPLGSSKRYSTGSDQVYSTPDQPLQPTKHTAPAPSTTELPPVLYQNFNETVQQFTAPVVVQFPEDTYVQEGEGVLFKVEVTGVPQPKLTWYHNGAEVEADYSKELAEDGSLTMASAEMKHTGVYKLVASNPAGRAEREVRLVVQEEGKTSGGSERMALDPVPVSKLGSHVEKNHSKNNKGFDDEFKSLYDGEDKSISTATNSENRRKNRFANICPYDDHRVVLKPLPGHPEYQGDYINGSYVDGYTKPSRFLSTQGPLPKTLVDFWRLVWQERPPSIVMITNLEEGGKIKCQRYWPESGHCEFGPFEVTLIDEQILADYTIRKLQAKLKGDTSAPLRVDHFHFTAWPDHGVPDYATPLLAFHRRVLKEHKPRKGPMMVHCSAGVGRTGTFITIDHVLEQVEKEGVVDIAGVINKIRQQRMKLVQTVNQYIFIHDAILESVTCGDTQIQASSLRIVMGKLRERPSKGQSGFQQQFSVLEKVSPNPREVKCVAAQNNPSKNRSTEFLPVDRWRVVLKGETPDYVHATIVHGYKQQRAFIIAQSPMQSTARDFWKVIYDKKCGVIVMLCNLMEDGKEVCYQYWPSRGSQNFGEFKVELLEQEEQTGFLIHKFAINHKKSGEVHHVSQFHITNWAPDGSSSNIKTVTDVIDEVIKVQIRTSNKPILIHCSDTVSRSGMFCAIATTIERCKTEGVVDVFQVVKALRVHKPGAIRNVWQYEAVFDTVLMFLDSFDTYANFNQ